MARGQQLHFYFIERDRAIRAMLIRHAALVRDISDSELEFLITQLREQHARRFAGEQQAG